MLPNTKRQKEGKEFFDEKGIKVFISENGWNKYLARNFLPAKLKNFQPTVRKTC